MFLFYNIFSTNVKRKFRITGYNRKYAITLLRRAGKPQLRRLGKETVKVTIADRGRRKWVCQQFCDEPVERAVVAIREFFRRVCEPEPKTPFQRLIEQKNSLDITALQEQLDEALDHRVSGTDSAPGTDAGHR
jgi:hypothetical protein